MCKTSLLPTIDKRVIWSFLTQIQEQTEYRQMIGKTPHNPQRN